MWIEIGGSLYNTKWIAEIKQDGHCVVAREHNGRGYTLLRCGAEHSRENVAQAQAEFKRIKGRLMEAKS